MSVEGTTRGGPPGALREGATFGGYRIERTLGHGGMGIVYLATELRLDRQVALKVIRSDLAGDEDFRARFRSESRTAASVEDPRVVTVFGAGERDGLLYVAMRYVPGRDLGQLVEADGPLPPDEAVRLIAQVADGLDAVHAAGLVHRDVKPHNVIVGEDGDAHLADFGLAKAMGATTGLTATGQVIGTVDYMAPEQIEARRVDARTDVYALGGVLLWALTGKVPYAERESSAKMWAHVNEPPPSAGRRGSVLDPVIRRAMAKDPIDRFPSAGDLGRAAVAATRGEAVTEPEHVVGAGEAAPLPETVRLSRDPALPPTDPQPRPGRGLRKAGFLLAWWLSPPSPSRARSRHRSFRATRARRRRARAPEQRRRAASPCPRWSASRWTSPSTASTTSAFTTAKRAAASSACSTLRTGTSATCPRRVARPSAPDRRFASSPADQFRRIPQIGSPSTAAGAVVSSREVGP